MPDKIDALLAPEVRTLARPVPGSLLAARTAIQCDTGLRQTFEQARREGWSADKLAGAITPDLERLLDAEPVTIIPVAQYLADEYVQIGDAMLIIDQMTGRAIARFTDEDLERPMVPREDGRMVEGLPRLNPNLHGFLVSYYHDQHRDQERLARIRERYPQTAFLQVDGEPRFRAVTRSGRMSMVDELREQLPGLLPTVRGASKGFLNHFDLRYDRPHVTGDSVELPKATAIARSQQSIVDPLTFNFKHDRLMALKARITTEWVREIAKRVALAAEPRDTTVKASDLNEEVLAPSTFWIVAPDAYATFLPFAKGLLPIPGVEPAGLDGNVGYIVLGETSVKAREVFGRWDIEATLEYTLFIYTARLRGMHVTDIPIEVVAEIV